ncbi:MAG: hypothetical protein AABW50_03180 [Nanoarchaeota archaeon]
MKNRMILAITGIFLFLILASFASPAGISPPYWEGYPLYMNYGETKTVNFNLQNMVGNEDISVEAVINQGSDIASLEKTTYTARAGTSDTMIPLTITIPNDFDKQIQSVVLEFKTVTPSGEGMVTLGTGWTTSFDVIISEKEVQKSSLVWIIILLAAVVLVLALIIYKIVKRRR